MPAAHATHAVVPVAVWYWPPGQGLHLAELAEPDEAMKVPGEQGTQTMEAVGAAANMPAPHGTHDVVPVKVWYWPASQLVQTAAASCEYVDMAQEVHVAEMKAPVGLE